MNIPRRHEQYTMMPESKRNFIENILENVNWREYMCGFGAAFINITLTYPINKIIFRQMLHGVKANTALSQIHGEGIYFLYRGMLPPLMQKTLSMSIMFGVYDGCLQPLLEKDVNPYLAKCIAGCAAGTVEAVLMPFERVQTILTDTKYHTTYKNTYQAFRSILVHYGVREYYRGLLPILLRNGPSNVCYFILRDECLKYKPDSSSHFMSTFFDFICGSLIGVTVSTLFYPLNVVKISLQRTVGGEFQSSYKEFLKVYRERDCKLRNIYHGVSLNSTRAMLSWGVISAAYSNLKLLLY